METNAKSRVIMLAVSGLLFGATAFGWVVHESSKGTETTDAAHLSAGNGAAGQTASQLTEESSVEIASTAIPAFHGYPSTSKQDAMRAARASIRQDPTQPVLAGAHVSRSERAIPRVNHSSYSGNDIVPPPPRTGLIDPPTPYPPGLDETNYGVAQAVDPKPAKLGVEDLRLVGVIEGKAIFKVRRKIADALALPYSVTLGKGETIGELKLQSVGKEVATVEDGSKVATKSLEPVH